MKQLFAFIFLSFISVFSFGQLVLNRNFQNAALVPCPANPSLTVTSYNEWEIYQTYNDEWDGMRDTNICISVTPLNWGCKIALNQIDTSRRMFIASKPNYNSGSYLPPHVAYNVPLDIDKIGNFDIEIGSNKSYVISMVRIPDSTLLDTTFRIQKFALDPVDSSSWQNYSYNTCIASEKFDTQYLRIVASALKFSNVDPTDTLRLDEFGTYDFNWAQPQFNAFSVPFDNGAYQVEYGSYDVLLVVYDDTTYPSNAHIDQAIVTPDPDPGYPVNMSITILPYNDLIFEPFTQLRAAEVIGQPGVFHNITLIQSGGEVCANIIELVFNGGDEFVYHSGGVNLNSSPSCFRFKNGATFRVAAGSELNYGSSNHSGILLMNDSSSLIIDEGATLNIWNRMMLREDHPENGAKQFYMTLNPRATLRFLPGSHLTNLYSVDNSIRLNVFMRGGELDDAGLPEEDKNLINRIYSDDFDSNNPFQLYPNPVRDELTVHCMGELISRIEIINAVGAEVFLQDVSDYKIGISIDQLPGGVYLIKCLTNKNEYVKKLIVE